MSHGVRGPTVAKRDRFVSIGNSRQRLRDLEPGLRKVAYPDRPDPGEVGVCTVRGHVVAEMYTILVPADKFANILADGPETALADL